MFILSCMDLRLERLDRDADLQWPFMHYDANICCRSLVFPISFAIGLAVRIVGTVALTVLTSIECAYFHE